MLAGSLHFARVFGDQAILARLERLGRNARIFPNLVKAGFPPEQLSLATQWYAEQAGTLVERYAGMQMARGFYEDESLLSLLCRYYECTDWKLEHSPWFLSKDDYERFYAALVDPVEFRVAQLEQGQGEERWGAYFLKLPFDLGMDRAKTGLWEEICHQEHYWKPMETYAHLRAENLLRYLERTVDVLHFTATGYSYYWERAFRERFHVALRRFEETLERSVRRWQEQRRERTTRRFHYRAYSRVGGYRGVIVEADLLEAFSLLGLDRHTATVAAVRKAFRKLSKEAHPDHGGSPEAFRKLTQSKELAEAWLVRRTRAQG